MVYRSFSDLIEKCRQLGTKRRVAVAGAADDHVLEAVIEADRRGLAESVLIGDEAGIRAILESLGTDAGRYEIVPAGGSETNGGQAAGSVETEAIGSAEAAAMTPGQLAGETAVRLIKEGRADFIMKGLVETRDVLKPLVNKENGLNLGRTMSVFSYNEVPQMNRLLGLSDGGMVIAPTLEQKRDIILNCVEVFHKLGVEEPSIALLAAIEKVNPKMPATVDAQALVEMNKRGEIAGCRLVGPVSFDIAMSREIAERKGYANPDCGDFDCVIVPDMTAGNLMHKAMIVCGGTKMAGIIVGAKVPVVLTSRGASAEEKFVSMALAALTA